jgi:hypothetical protein
LTLSIFVPVSAGSNACTARKQVVCYIINRKGLPNVMGGLFGRWKWAISAGKLPNECGTGPWAAAEGPPYRY